MGFSLVVLSIGSLFSGYCFKDMFIGLGSNFFGSSIYKVSQNNIGLDNEFVSVYIKNTPVFFSFMGALLVYQNNIVKTPLFIKFYLFFQQK